MKKLIPFRPVRFGAILPFLALSFATIPFPSHVVSLRRPALADDVIRACRTSDAALEAKSSNAKKKKAKGNSDELSPGACVEVRTGILEVQEILQAKVRDLRWNIHDEILNDSSWLFLRDLGVDELLGMTTEDKRPQDVEWKSGSVTVRVTTTDVGEGFTRTIILAQFRGIGATKDKLKVQHDWWPMASNGSLEESLMEAVRKHFAPASQ